MQDLAATELEEAFDHVDVVVKRADHASVTVDGGMALSLKVRGGSVEVYGWTCVDRRSPSRCVGGLWVTFASPLKHMG